MRVFHHISAVALVTSYMYCQHFMSEGFNEFCDGYILALKTLIFSATKDCFISHPIRLITRAFKGVDAYESWSRYLGRIITLTR